MIDLLTHPQRWVRRRVEQLEFLDDRVVKRSVSVDFRLPTWYAESPQIEEVGVWLAPLAMLVKRPLVNFDLRDEEGRSLSLVDSRESGLIAAATLIVAAGDVLRRHGQEHDEGAIVPDLERVANCELGEAEDAVRRAVDSHDATRSSRLLLSRHGRTDRLIRDLSRNFPVLTPLSQPTADRVLKFSYEEPLGWPRRPWKRKTAALAWRAAPLALEASGAAAAQSYHCEVQAPNDLEIRDAELIATWQGGHRHVSNSGSESQRVHLYISDLPTDAKVTMKARIQPDRLELLWSSVVLGLISSLLLTGGVLFRDRVGHASNSTDTLLVAVPALLAAYLVTTGEHDLTRRLLSGVRLLVAAIGVFAFLSAATLALGFDSPTALLVAWTPLASLSWLATLFLGIGLVARRRSDGTRGHPSG